MQGGAIDALKAEVEEEPDALRAFVPKVHRASKGAMFVGAGDSYAAALAGFYFTGGRCIALDPYSLASAPGIAEGLEVYFISASGRTASNLAAARRVRGIARRTVALTAVEASPLADLVDDVVPLPMKYAPRTAGMLSFSLSLSAVLKLSGEDDASDFHGAFRDAKRDRRRLELGSGTTYVLGNSTGYVAALYTAAKAYELLGAKAHAELLEEFSHLELFSLVPEDKVLTFSCFDPYEMAKKLRRALSRSGYSVGLIPSHGDTDTEQLFHSIFVGQLSILDAADKAGLREPRFLASGRRLQASDWMIY